MPFSFKPHPDPAFTPIYQLPYSPVLGVEELAELLRKSPSTILQDHSRAPHRLPPGCEPPGTRTPLWLLDDVLAWLRQYQRPAAPAQVPAAVASRRRGRPTKAEQVARCQAAQAKGGEQ